MKKKLEELNYKARPEHLEKVNCNLCGSKEYTVEVVEHGLQVVRCKSCGLVYVNPRPNDEEIQRFYDRYYPEESTDLWAFQMMEVFKKEGLREIKKHLSQGRLLDIGCGYGYFLDLMSEHGFDVHGVEISEPAARFAREKLNLDVFIGKLKDSDLPKRSFDVVTLWYVLEHLSHPVDELKLVNNMLRKGGMVIIRVPNRNVDIDKILARVWLKRFFLINPPRHLHDYSPKTIKAILEKCGFKIMDIKNGIPRKTGTVLELIRRYIWYIGSQIILFATLGRAIRGSSITVYAKKVKEIE